MAQPGAKAAKKKSAYQLTIGGKKYNPQTVEGHRISNSDKNFLTPTDLKYCNNYLKQWCENPNNQPPGYSKEATENFLSSIQHSETERCPHCCMALYLAKPMPCSHLSQKSYCNNLRNDVNHVIAGELDIGDIKEPLENCLRIFRSYRGGGKYPNHLKNVKALKAEIISVLQLIRNFDAIPMKFLYSIDDLLGKILVVIEINLNPQPDIPNPDLF